MRFESPYAFLLLLGVPALVYWRLHRRAVGALVFSTVRHAALAGGSWKQRLQHLPAGLRILALVILVVALARPQCGMEKVEDASEGIGIMMVVDRSGSMQAPMEFGGQRMTRLDVVKRVFGQFVHGDGAGLSGRPDDLIGMVAFARYADTACPLTLAHDALDRFLEQVQFPTEREEDGTALGEAMALAAARLRTAEETLTRQRISDPGAYRLKSKIMIVLTDGQSNFGMEPVKAAEVAKEWGIKVYSIGVGDAEMVQTLVGAVQAGPGLDTATLRTVAERTGGVFRVADDGEALAGIYREIDQLEKSELKSERYLDYREWFMPLVLAALVCIAAEALLNASVFRRAP